MAERKPVVYQEWEESERGWGERPDGYSIHLSKEDLKKFISMYWDSMPDRDRYGNAPDEYSRPCGHPELRLVKSTTQKLLEEAKKQGKYGLRYSRYSQEEEPAGLNEL